jgi:cell wall-associated NlpC family hydrolase
MFKKKLALECLEGREMMSAGGLASLSGPVLPDPASQGVAAALTGSSAGLFPALPDLYEPDNSAAAARTISTNGRAQPHTIHRPADVDWVRFTLHERSHVAIRTSGFVGNTEIAVFGPGSSTDRIAFSDGNGGFARIELGGASALGAGTYYVRVGEFGHDARIGLYRLGVKATPAPLPDDFEPDDTRDAARPIGVNAGPQARTIHLPNDVDWATFELAVAADVVIETRGASGDTRLWLYGADPDAAPIEFDNNDGVGNFSVIVRSGAKALAAGTYYVKVDEAGQNAPIGNYTLSVTALEPGDVLLAQGKDGLSKAIRLGEAHELNVAFADTFSHAAIYVGNGQVAEMLASGFAVTSLAKRYAESRRVDILRDLEITSPEQGEAVVDAALAYAGTPYGFAQIGVFATAVLFSDNPQRVRKSLAYAAYQSRDSGPRRMICSELVALAFDDAGLPIDVKLWPTLGPIGNAKAFRMDFTSPTMLALSPDLERLNA